MGRPPCCDKNNVKKGPWTDEEDAKLLAHITMHGTGNWASIPNKTGLKRCGKSCRLRWTNYLRPDLKHDSFTSQEEELILNLHAAIGSRWSLIAAQLPGRTDNDVKNYWNTRLRKKLCGMGIDPVTRRPISQILSEYAGNVALSGGNEDQLANARISCLSKDLRNTYYAFNGNYSKNPHDQTSVPLITINNNVRNASDSHSNLWDVLAQLNTIKTASSASAQPESRTSNEFSSPNQLVSAGDNLFSGLELCEGNGNGNFIIPVANNIQQPLTWSEFLMEEEEFMAPVHEEDWEWQNRQSYYFQPLELQNIQQDGENTAGSENSICNDLQMQMQRSPQYSYTGRKHDNVGDSSLDSLLLSSEYPLFWDFL